MGPEHVPRSCLWEAVLADVKFCVFSKWAPNTSRYPVSGRLIFTIVVFLRYGPRTRPAILSRGGCSCKRQVLCFFERGPEHVPLSCVGQVDFYNCAVFEIWAPNTSRYPVSRKLFLQLQQTGVSEIWAPNTSHYLVSGMVVLSNVRFCVFSKWAPNTSRYPVSGRLSRLGQGPAILCRVGCSYNCCVNDI